MKVQRFNFENNEIIQIYINRLEQNDSKIIEEINQLKKQFSNISIFISGNNETVKTIKEMLNYEKSRKVKENDCICYKKKIIYK